jgi:hypothetical protein
MFSNCEGRRENFWGISCEKSRFYANFFFLLILGGGGTTTLDREWFTIICQNLKDVCIVFSTGGNLFIDGMELHLVSFSTYTKMKINHSFQINSLLKMIPPPPHTSCIAILRRYTLKTITNHFYDRIDLK